MNRLLKYIGKFSIPVFCYLPALVLVCMSIAPIVSLTKESSRLTERITKLEEGKAELEKTQAKNNGKRPEPEQTKAVALAIQNSDFARAYVDGRVKEEVNDQVKEAAADEIAIAKGDLLGQSTLPVLFAIASIFAAFAVKDVLTEILKDGEKEKVQRALREDIEKLIGLKISASDTEFITVKDLLLKCVGIDGSSSSKSLKNQLEDVINEEMGKCLDRVSTLEKNSVDGLKVKLGQISYEIAELTATNLAVFSEEAISGKDDEILLGLTLDSSLRAVGILQELIKEKPANQDVLNLVLRCELIILTSRFAGENLSEDNKEKLKKLEDCAQESISSEKTDALVGSLRASMKNIFEIRIHQLHEMLESLSESADDNTKDQILSLKKEIYNFNPSFKTYLSRVDAQKRVDSKLEEDSQGKQAALDEAKKFIIKS